MAKLIEHMPNYYNSSGYVSDFTHPIDLENKNLKINIDELKLQFIVDTATYSLEKYEEEYGLPINPLGLSFEERRSRIKAKMRSVGVVNKALIENVVESWTHGNVEIIEDFANFTFTVRFIDTVGIPINMQDVYNAIAEIKPAHLIVNYEFKYRRYEELKSKTHQQLSQFTHQTIREGVI